MKKTSSITALLFFSVLFYFAMILTSCQSESAKAYQESHPYIITLYNDDGEIIKGPIEATEVYYPGETLHYTSQGVQYIWKGDYEIIYPLD